MDNAFYKGFVGEMEKIAALPALGALAGAAGPALAKIGPKVLPFLKTQVAPAAAQGAAMTAGSGLAQKLTAPRKPKPGA